MANELRYYVETQETDWLVDPETDKKVQRIAILRRTSCNSYEDAIDFVREVNTFPGIVGVTNARYLGMFATRLVLHPDLSDQKKLQTKKKNIKFVVPQPVVE